MGGHPPTQNGVGGEEVAGQGEGGDEGTEGARGVAGPSRPRQQLVQRPGDRAVGSWRAGSPGLGGERGGWGGLPGAGRKVSGDQQQGGRSQSVTASPAPALQLVSNDKTFSRVEEERSWLDALQYCRTHHTDLADLQSVDSLGAVKTLYSLTSGTQAWVGLFFDVSLGSLRWSSGSVFTAPVWSSLPVFKEGICATLYSVAFAPSLGAASCAARKPFICYYGVFPAERPAALPGPTKARGLGAFQGQLSP